VYGGKGISYVIHSNLFKMTPPLSRTKESYHKVLACITRLFFRFLKGSLNKVL